MFINRWIYDTGKCALLTDFLYLFPVVRKTLSHLIFKVLVTFVMPFRPTSSGLEQDISQQCVVIDSMSSAEVF